MAGARISWPLPQVENRLPGTNMDRYLADNKSSQSISTTAFSEKGHDDVFGEDAVGSTALYDANGKLRLIPAPTPDPKDPLNMPKWRKYSAVAVICLFGSLALTAEIIIGGLIPLFLVFYSGVDVKILNTTDFTKISRGSSGFNPMALLPPGTRPANLGQIALLATVPLLTSGFASYLFVPLSISLGRRPVLLLAGLCAWGGSLWAGVSGSLSSHLIARGFQGLGSGAIEGLVPLILQDMFFIHQRNKAMSAIISSQGIVIICLGIAGPYIASNYDWRWLYYLTGGFGAIVWIGIVFLVPETRWMRSKQELSGHQLYPVKEGEDRPTLDYKNFTPPTKWTYLGMFHFGIYWREGGLSILNTLRTTYFPSIIWATLTGSIFVIINSTVQQTISFALLAQGWQFQYTGLSVVPFILAAFLVYVFAGPVADKISNAAARHNNGRREPEHNLINAILPFATGIIGAFVFGWAGENNAHWAVFMTAAFLILFSMLTVTSVVNVFLVESYPQWAGPVLVNVGSLKTIIAFFVSSKSTTLIAERGFFNTIVIFAEVLILIALGLPVVYFWGKKFRAWTGGKVVKVPNPRV